MLSSRVIGEGPLPGSAIIRVWLRIEYVLRDGDPIREDSTNQVVMVHQDGRWLMDAPPKK